MQHRTQYVTEQINSSNNTSHLYSRDIRLESYPRHSLTQPRSFLHFLNHSMHMPAQYINQATTTSFYISSNSSIIPPFNTI